MFLYFQVYLCLYLYFQVFRCLYFYFRVYLCLYLYFQVCLFCVCICIFGCICVYICNIMITRRRIKGRLDCGEASATNADRSVLLLLPSLIHLHISHNTQIGAFGKPVLVCSLYLHLYLYIIFAHFVHCIYTLCAFYLHTARTGLVLGGSMKSWLVKWN